MYVEGLTLKEPGAPDGLDPLTMLYRLKKFYSSLRQGIDVFLRERLRLSPSECETFIRSTVSELVLRIICLFPGQP